MSDELGVIEAAAAFNLSSSWLGKLGAELDGVPPPIPTAPGVFDCEAAPVDPYK